MIRFNLLEEAWIPCLDEDGRVRHLGLSDSLRLSHTMHGIEGESPLITAALYRLQLAVLHRVFGPRNTMTWGQLWRLGRFPEQPLSDYWSKWVDRFELFDETHPFFQSGWVSDDMGKVPIGKLDFARASGNNATLFDHSSDQEVGGVSAAEAARLLVAHQLASLGGLIGALKETKGDGGGKLGKDAPSARGAFSVLTGRNLFETLMLNLSQHDGSGTDRPCWESEAGEVNEKRPIAGRVDLMTWQSRTLRLYGKETDHGIVVSFASLAPGIEAQNPEMVPTVESLQIFRGDRKAKADRPAIKTLNLDVSRASWRDSASIFYPESKQEDAFHRLNWMRRLIEEGELDEQFTAGINVLGMATEPGKQKIYLWRSEYLPLRSQIIDGRAPLMEDYMRGALGVSEEIGGALRWSGKRLLQELGDRDGKQGASRVERMLENFWGSLQLPYLTLLDLMCKAVEGEDEGERFEQLASAWRYLSYRSARLSFEKGVSGLSVSVRGLKAEAVARTELDRCIWKCREKRKGTSSGQ